jgi:hypothetical protein
MLEFQQFVQAADTNSVDVVLDASFNHTEQDVELAALGQGVFVENLVTLIPIMCSFFPCWKGKPATRVSARAECSRS